MRVQSHEHCIVPRVYADAVFEIISETAFRVEVAVG
jgi:hypothetical protein